MRTRVLAGDTHSTSTTLAAQFQRNTGIQMVAHSLSEQIPVCRTSDGPRSILAEAYRYWDGCFRFMRLTYQLPT